MTKSTAHNPKQGESAATRQSHGEKMVFTGLPLTWHENSTIPHLALRERKKIGPTLSLSPIN